MFLISWILKLGPPWRQDPFMQYLAFFVPDLLLNFYLLFLSKYQFLGYFWGIIFESRIYFGKPKPFLYRLGVLGSNKSGSPKFLIANIGSYVIPAENNPLNDYPDEESSEDEEVESRSSHDQSTEEHSAYEEDISDHNEETDWRWEHR